MRLIGKNYLEVKRKEKRRGEKMHWEDITNYIPKGADNRITKETLMVLTGYNERVIRQAIEDARRNGVRIVSNSGRKGYYVAETDDEWLSFLNEHKRRAMAELSLYSSGLKHLNDSQMKLEEEYERGVHKD
jgi:MoaA/NifB/PqqE/SkfB family radical SAM enzyme